MRGRARWTLIGVLLVLGGLTAFGLLQLWPDSNPRPVDPAAAFAAPGVTFPNAKILHVAPPCRPGPSSQQGPGSPASTPSGIGGGQRGGSASRCGNLVVRVTDGASSGRRATIPVAPEVSKSGLRPGDRLRLLRTPPATGVPASFGYFGVDRSRPIWVLGLVFAFVVAVVARLRGILALVGLAVGGLVLVRFMLPALLTGGPGPAVAWVGSSTIMFVVLYLAHGVSLRTSSALAGTLMGITITAVAGTVGIHGSRLTGVPDESGAILSSFVADVNFQGLLTAAVIIAGLGVLNDVTITQASAVWEIRAASPDMNRRRLFTAAMRIGRDHIASTIYRMVFAYAGAALSVLLLLFLYDRPLAQLISTEDIAEEIVRTFASGIGLVLSVPVTTAIAAAVVAPVRRRSPRSGALR